VEDGERMTQFFDGTIHDLNIQEVQLRIMEFQHSRQEFSHESGMEIVLRTIKKRTDLLEDFLSREHGAGPNLR
jgi:hypothetical protein